MQTRTVTLELTDLQIELLRRWIGEAPTNPYVPMVAGVLPQLPMDTDPDACDRYLDYRSVAARSSAEGSPAVSQVPEAAGGFQLRSWTSKGDAALPSLLARLPHVGDL